MRLPLRAVQAIWFSEIQPSCATRLIGRRDRGMIRVDTDSVGIGDEAVDNDHTSFDAIYRDYYARIRRYLARLVGMGEAEDLTQEVFLKISRSLDSFRGESSIATWVYRIATNAAIDRVRSPAYRSRVSSAPVEESREADEVVAAAEDRVFSAEEDAIRREMSGCVQDLMTQLPENYRTVLVLSEIEGMKNSEIAEVLGLSLETVKIRLHRARRRLKEILEANCSFYRDPCNTLLCDIKRSGS